MRHAGAVKEKEVITVKGYYTSSGFMGWTGSGYMLFATASDYYDYMA